MNGKVPWFWMNLLPCCYSSRISTTVLEHCTTPPENWRGGGGGAEAGQSYSPICKF